MTGLLPRQLKTLNGDELAAFKPAQIKAIDQDSISGLRPGSLNALRKRQVRSFSDDQLPGLTKKQIRKADDFVERLSKRQLDALPFGGGRFGRLGDSSDQAEDQYLVSDLDPLV